MYAISLTFTNKLTEETIFVLPNGQTDTSSLDEKEQTIVDGHIRSFSSELVVDASNETAPDLSGGLWSISFNGQAQAGDEPFDPSAGHEKTELLSAEYSVNEFICGVSSLVDDNYIFAVSPIICSF